MTEQPAPAFTDALVADAATPDYPGRMRRFGQLVGSWAVKGSRLNEVTGDWLQRDFLWLVAFILDGRAVQDVELVANPDQASGFDSIATAIRVYDPHAGAWRVSYMAPTLNEYCHLVATPHRNGLRQDGTRTDGSPIRWNFTSITPETYTWEGWVSADEGSTWLLVEHNEATRIA